MTTLRGKYVRDLTPEDERALRKPLGVKGAPYPMKDIAFTGAGKTTGHDVPVDDMVLLEDNNNPMVVWSDRPYGDVQGMAIRNMPTPSMLRIFRQALKRRDPHNRFRVQFFKGPAGAGKTFLAEEIGLMGSVDGAVKVDCTGLNAAELLWETVLDFNSDKTFYNELDKRIRNGKLNPVSIKHLKAALGDAFHQDKNGKIAIDWDRVGHSLPTPETADLPRQDRRYIDSGEAIQIAVNELNKIAALEGLSVAGGNALGMKTQKGVFIRCFEEGRECILDEFNRLKPGTTGILHGPLQFAIGDTNLCVSNNTLKDKDDIATHSYTFDEKNRKVGWFTTLTGNTEADGSDINELPQSLSSRIQPIRVPEATLEDWQHRVGQLYTGLPLSTLYRAGQKQWDGNPDDFRSILQAWRKLKETGPIPDYHLRLLRRWEDVQTAVTHIAKFYYMCSQTVNPESPLHRAGGSLSSVLAEIDETLMKELSIDFRRISADLKDSLTVDPESTPLSQSGGFDLKAVGVAPDLKDGGDKTDPLSVMGTSLTKVVMDRLLRDTDGRPHLRAQWLQFAVDCKLIRPKLHEGKLNESRTIAELLDETPYDSLIPSVQAEYIQSLTCDYLRNHYRDLSKDNEDLVALTSVRRLIDTVMADNDPVEGSDEEAEQESLIVFNEDAAHGAPFRRAYDFDPTPIEGETEESGQDVPVASDLVAADALVATLAAPGLRQRNLTALFNQAITMSGAVVQAANEQDESLAIAEDTSPLGLAVTTVMVRGGMDGADKDVATPLHVIWNRQADRVMVVCQGQPCPALKKAFRASRLSYVDRTADDAEMQSARALEKVLGGTPDTLGPRLKTAFLFRNALPDADAEKAAGLGALLVRGDVECFLPHFIVKGGPKPVQA